METETLRKSILTIMGKQLKEVAAISKYLMEEGARNEDIADLVSNISVYAVKSTECSERVLELANDKDMLIALDTFGHFVRAFELKAVAGMARLGFEIEFAILRQQ